MRTLKSPLFPEAWPLTLLSVLACLSGCGSAPAPTRPATHPVSGQVLYQDAPVARALVVFHPADLDQPILVRSYARTDAHGQFQLSTFQFGDGAPAGRYVVTVSLPDDKEGTELLPVQYAVPATSGLQVQIHPGENRLNPFILKRR